MPLTVIAGLGMAGLACALELDRRGLPFRAFEREARPGGLARTESVAGFQFDHGPHILLDIPAELKSLFAELPGLALVDCAGHSRIAVGAGLDRVVPVPFQRNLHCLSLVDRLRIFYDLTIGKASKRPVSYREFVIQRCGKRVFELFLGGYETKRLCFSLDEIPPDWTSRVEAPSLRALVAKREPDRPPGAKESRFRYPRSGGIEALPRSLASLLPDASVHCGDGVVQIDVRRKHIVASRSGAVGYDHLVLSLPLPEIVRLIKDPPAAVADAASRLAYASVYVVSLGVEGPVPPWTFLRFPAADIGFYRVSFPSTYSAGCAPAGANIVMTELSHHPQRHPVSPDQALERCRAGLIRAGVIRRDQKIVVERVQDIRYGHPIPTRDTATHVALILDYLKQHAISVCGKYGLWKDLLMTHSMLSGQQVARDIAARFADSAERV